MANDIELSEQEEAKRQELAQKLQNNILGLGDVEGAIQRLTKQKEGLVAAHMALDNDIREFNGVIKEKYAPKEEPVLSVEE